MPSPLAAAYMCLATYEDTDDAKMRFLPVGWEWVRDLSKRHIGANTFSALTFRQPENNKVMLAIRGTITQNIADLRADLDILLFGIETPYRKDPRSALDQYIKYAKEMLNEIREKFPNDEIIVGGHSLGALIAEIIAIEENLRAITFDSPGGYPFLNADLIAKNDKLITTYLSAPHLINTRHKHIAKKNLFMIYIPRVPYAESKAMSQLWNFLSPKLTPYLQNLMGAARGVPDEVIQYTLQQHALSNIVLAFDPNTQQPYHALHIREWVDWTRGAFRQGVTAIGQIFAPQYHGDIVGATDYLTGLNIEHRFAHKAPHQQEAQTGLHLINGIIGASTIFFLMNVENKLSFSHILTCFFVLANLLIAVTTVAGLAQFPNRKESYKTALFQLNHYRMHHASLADENKQEPDAWRSYLALGHTLQSNACFFKPNLYLPEKVINHAQFDMYQWGSIFLASSAILSTFLLYAPNPQFQGLLFILCLANLALFSPIIYSGGEQFFLDYNLRKNQKNIEAVTQSTDLTSLKNRMDSFRRLS